MSDRMTEEDIRQRLKELNESGQLEGLESEADKVEGLLISPDNILIAVGALEELEANIKRRKEKHERVLSPYKHKMEVWEKQGFDVAGLHTVLSQEKDDLEAVERLFYRFEKMVERLVNMEKDLLLLDASEFEVEIEALGEIIAQPDRWGEYARRYHHLHEQIRTRKRECRRRKELKDIVEQYSSQGWKADALEPAFKANLQDLEVAVSEFEDSVIILQEYETRLGALDRTGREKLFKELEKKLRDPANLVEVIDTIEMLEGSS